MNKDLYDINHTMALTLYVYSPNGVTEASSNNHSPDHSPTNQNESRGKRIVKEGGISK